MEDHRGARKHQRCHRGDHHDRRVGLLDHLVHQGHLDRRHGHRDRQTRRTWLASVLGLGGSASLLAMDDVHHLDAQRHRRIHRGGQPPALRLGDLHRACHQYADLVEGRPDHRGHRLDVACR